MSDMEEFPAEKSLELFDKHWDKIFWHPTSRRAVKPSPWSTPPEAEGGEGEDRQMRTDAQREHRLDSKFC